MCGSEECSETSVDTSVSTPEFTPPEPLAEVAEAPVETLDTTPSYAGDTLPDEVQNSLDDAARQLRWEAEETRVDAENAIEHLRTDAENEAEKAQDAIDERLKNERDDAERAERWAEDEARAEAEWEANQALKDAETPLDESLAGDVSSETEETLPEEAVTETEEASEPEVAETPAEEEGENRQPEEAPPEEAAKQESEELAETEEGVHEEVVTEATEAEQSEDAAVPETEETSSDEETSEPEATEAEQSEDAAVPETEETSSDEETSEPEVAETPTEEEGENEQFEEVPSEEEAMHLSTEATLGETWEADASEQSEASEQASLTLADITMTTPEGETVPADVLFRPGGEQAETLRCEIEHPFVSDLESSRNFKYGERMMQNMETLEKDDNPLNLLLLAEPAIKKRDLDQIDADFNAMLEYEFAKRRVGADYVDDCGPAFPEAGDANRERND